jgi:hypothetical protein
VQSGFSFTTNVFLLHHWRHQMGEPIKREQASGCETLQAMSMPKQENPWRGFYTRSRKDATGLPVEFHVAAKQNQTKVS